MLVVMQPGRSYAEVVAVRDHARQAGWEAEVFTDAGRIVVSVGVELDGAQDGALKEQLAGLPGVELVVSDAAAGSLQTRDLRIASIRPLVPPAILLEQLPLPATGAVLVRQARAQVSRIVNRQDDRLLVVVGPCSIHDPDAALDYARRLKALAGELARDLCIVMRVYFEKPRTTVGWKGLINDPRLDGSFGINAGLHLARRLLLDLVALGMPVGCEFLDPILPQFFADTVTWAAIGARTTESQVHRELASGLSMPVGFKNGTGGGIQIAIDAVRAAAYPHHFLSVTEQGLAAIVATRGNADCHVILRGGRTGPNYDAGNIATTLVSLRDAGLTTGIMIDTSHGNSEKDYRRQPLVARAVAEQLAAGQTGITGVLMESFLVAGHQELVDRTQLVYGQSVTDSCLDWDTTVTVLRELATAVAARRARQDSDGRAARHDVVASGERAG